MKLELIKITQEQKKFLDSLKIHDRQPYYEVLESLIPPHKVPKKDRTLKSDLDRLKRIIKKRSPDYGSKKERTIKK